MSPARSNILGGIQIRIEYATRCTDKLERVTMTTGTTAMTGLGGIGRINQYQWHAGVLRFVCDALSELGERPTVVVVALGFPALRPLPNAGQVFQGNLALGGVGRLHQAFADCVVDVAHMPSLPTRQAF